MLHTPTLMEIHERGQKNEKYRFIHRVRWGGARRAAGGIKTCRDDEQIQGKNEGKMFASSTLTVDKLHEFCLDFFFRFLCYTHATGAKNQEVDEKV